MRLTAATRNMLDLTHNGVILLDAVIERFKWSKKPESFFKWWASLSQEKKQYEVIQSLIHKYGEASVLQLQKEEEDTNVG